MSPGLRFEYAALTHPGCVRAVNEDAILQRADALLWAVADGMGGHANGQWASESVVAAMRRAVLGDAEGCEVAVRRALEAANLDIRQAGAAAGATMGSTVAALMFEDQHFTALWAGDSRIYLARRGRLQALTCDHSQVRQLIEAGLLTEVEADGHPLGHVLTRAVGADDALELDRHSDLVVAGDVFLICSDGLTRSVSTEEIARLLPSPRPELAAERLLKLALGRGAPDNVSLVVVTAEATTLMR